MLMAMAKANALALLQDGFNADAGDVLVSEIAGCKHTNPADCLRPQVASPGCFSYLSSATRTPVDGTLTPPR